MSDLVASILLADGPARITAQAGAYDIDKERMDIAGPLMLSAADGYRMVVKGVTVDLAARRMTGSEGVEGAIPAGTFSADHFIADIDTRTITLAGNARVTMIPGQLRMP